MSKEWADCVFHNLPISIGKCDLSIQSKAEFFERKEKISIKSLYEMSKKDYFSNPYDFLRSN
ncbi:MAG: hypothetical protein EKK64_03320 [Neisseriaceae bacterium]|nr:MAG: hypothetical protein EKK64_03320 [Neisseriaceae bacterium]